MEKNETPVGSFKVNMAKSGQTQVEQSKKPPESAKGKIHKKTLSDKFNEAFVKEDMKSVGKYLFIEKIVPDFIQMIRDAIFDGITMHFGLGGGRPGSSSKPGGYKDYSTSSTSSNYYYKSSGGSTQKPDVKKKHEGPEDWRDIYFDSKEKAEKAINKLRWYADTYPMATVSNYYDAAGLTPDSFTDNDWGWNAAMLEKVSYTRLMQDHELRYYPDLPDPVYIND